MKTIRLTILATMVSALWAGMAMAQDATAQAQVSTAGTTQVGMALPGQTPAAATVGGSDHDSVVGHLAIGYLGRSGMTIGADGQGAQAVAAPIIGVRYWLDPRMGIDAGIGFRTGTGSTTTETGGNSVDTDEAHPTVVMLHGGLPLALASAGHFTFLIVPELNLGLGTATLDPTGDAKTTYSAWHIDVGARAGAEIQFGFIGIPQLSLQGSVGVRADIDNRKTEDTTAGNVTTTYKNSSTAFATTVYDNPWNIFTSNVSALYYF